MDTVFAGYSFDTEYQCDNYTNSAGCTKLMYLIINADWIENYYEYIEQLLADENINMKNKKGWSALMIACAKYRYITGMERVIKLLVDKEANVNIRSTNGTTALMLAVASSYENSNVVELLINRGANVNAKRDDGYTPLWCACARSHHCIGLKMMKLLIENGANVNTKARGCTVLMNTARFSYDGVESLLHNGAEINGKDDDGKTALIHAINSKNNSDKVKIVKFLIENGADINFTDNDDSTLLMYACNNLEIIKLLISKGANIRTENMFGETVLSKAISQGDSNIDVIKYLLRNDIDINKLYGNHDQFTLLGTALPSQRENVNVVKLLIEKGADINLKNKYGLSPLLIYIYYATKINPELLKILLENGANVNDRTVNNQTPLVMISSDINKMSYLTLDILEMLIRYGADMDVMDFRKCTFFDYAMENYNKEIFEYLARYYPKKIRYSKIASKNIDEAVAIAFEYKYQRRVVKNTLKDITATYICEFLMAPGRMNSKLMELKWTNDYNKIEKDKYRNALEYYGISNKDTFHARIHEMEYYSTYIYDK